MLTEQNNTSTTSRFSGAPWYEAARRLQVCVGGAGGIGSWTTLFLLRAGFSVISIDNDTIDYSNLGGQFFGVDDVGKKKVTALYENCTKFSTNVRLHVFHNEVTELSRAHALMVTAFDNMKARRIMFEKWVAAYGTNSTNSNHNGLFIDPRLSMEQMWIYAIRSGDMEKIDFYRKNKLPKDEDLPDEPCSAKQTTHSAAIIAGLITSLMTNHTTNIAEKADIRDVPFETQIILPLFKFESNGNSKNW